MTSARHLLAVVALVVSGCGEYTGVDGGPATGSGATGAGGAATGGAAAVGGTSADGGNAPSGGAPTVNEGGCESVAAGQSLPTVTLAHDECQGQPDVMPPPSASACVLWTGLGYLHATRDPRGIVVSSLDQDGVLVHEEILDTQLDDTLDTQPDGTFDARLSRNGDRVLLVLDFGLEGTAVGVLDLDGVPLTPLNPLSGKDYPSRFNFAVTPSADGWLVAFGYVDPIGSRGILFSAVSSDGVVSKQYVLKVGGYVTLAGFGPGDSGEVLLKGNYDSGGQFGAFYQFVARVDQELDAVSCVELWID